MTFATKEEFERLGGPTVRLPSNTQTSTICLGKQILIHAMSSDVAWDIIRRWKLPPRISAGFDQIWPIRVGAVGWPNGHILTDAGIALVADEFANKASKLLRSKYGSLSSPQTDRGLIFP